MAKRRRHIVIVGAGFGGLAAARTFGDVDVDVTVIDRRNHHLFQPLLYQVATAGLSPAEIATPIRSTLADHKNIRVIFCNVIDIDKHRRMLITSNGEISYDVLILACGSQHSYFGNDHWEEHAPGLKTLEQATEIRRRILLAFEQAENSDDPDVRREYQTFVVVGGGPTGVELAGAIAEISRTSLKKDFRRIRPERTRVILIEGGGRVLSQFSEQASEQAARDLEELGVQVWTSTRVTNVTAAGVELGGETLRARTVIWAAGVKPSALNKKLGVPLDRSGRVAVNDDLSVPGHKEIFVVGDQAAVPDGKGGFLPGLASVAMQQGRYVADRILRFGPPATKPFVYKSKGNMATIGRSRAVVEVGRFSVSGQLAWLAWLFVHIFYLIGFKNRIFVFIHWAFAYLTFQRGARLITSQDWRLSKESLSHVREPAPVPVREPVPMPEREVPHQPGAA